MPDQPYTLLMCLDGPMQSWGTDSKFGIRETRTEPSKSGVIGLVAAALGRSRSDDISDLTAFRFGVRVDREGKLRRDFHTAGKSGFYRAKGSVERKSVIVSNRYYLADACFTVGLEGTGEEALRLLRTSQAALLSPHWPLYFGRRAFPPARPVVHPDGVVPHTLADALQGAGLVERHDEPGDGRFRFVLDIPALPDHADAETRQTLAGPDQPVSFGPRRYTPRQTAIVRLPVT